MSREEGRYVASIPGEYTESEFHLQYFVSSKRGGQAVLSPGLDGKLANEPYYTVLQG